MYGGERKNTDIQILYTYILYMAINFRVNSCGSNLCRVEKKWYKSKTGSTYGYYFTFGAIFLNSNIA